MVVDRSVRARAGKRLIAAAMVVAVGGAWGWAAAAAPRGTQREAGAQPGPAGQPPAIAQALDAVLAAENQGRQLVEAPLVDDLAFLRRVTVDLIGRIPTVEEIDAYLALPAEVRREQTIDRLLADPRFADRWSVFFADMLRIRSGAAGGEQFLAFVHAAVEQDMPYDEMCRRLLAANGRPSAVPEVGWVLGDNANPMALAGATAQVFLGVRIACAECHDHPFDKWTREQFYGLAAYFGKTQRVESALTQRVYTTEAEQTTVLWPPEDVARGGPRAPMPPAFPFELVSAEGRQPGYIERLAALRAARAAATQKAREETVVEDLLADADRALEAGQTDGAPQGAGLDLLDVQAEARREAQRLNVQADLYRPSMLRQELASLLTDPRNLQFARNLVNRLWHELLGRGFVEPVDDFSDNNPPSHPKTLDYLAEEFVASGYQFRAIVRAIVSSRAYQRSQLYDVPEAQRQESEAAFVAAPLRRMLAEALYDSIVQAGHLFSEKWGPGENVKTVRQLVQVPVEGKQPLAPLDSGGERMRGSMPARAMVVDASGYDLETAVEVDFDAVLAAAAEELKLEQMQAASREELEAEMSMAGESAMRRYVERFVEVEIDDNPRFASAMRMASPAAPSHFLRIFGQPAREALGDHRDHSANMRQALLMLNGKLTHEASRVGTLEPIHELVCGRQPDLAAAVRYAYREILTRDPTDEELAEGLAIVQRQDAPREGMADLRWVLFNCHEFRFLP
jgi:hypothetical protein